MTTGGEDETDWDPDAYDDGHSFVYEHGAALLDVLDPGPDERVLDLGCGTGHLTGEIADRGATVVGLDESPEMIATARESFPTCTFVRADATDWTPDGSFDAVFSNAALHWIDDQDAVLGTVRDALRPGGRFVAELGGVGNVQTIVGALERELTARGYDVANPWYFPSIGEYTPRLERHGFEVRAARLFDRPTELEQGADGLANWLRMFGETFFEDVTEDDRDAILTAVEGSLRDELFREGRWIADYRRLRIVTVATDR